VTSVVLAKNLRRRLGIHQERGAAERDREPAVLGAADLDDVVLLPLVIAHVTLEHRIGEGELRFARFAQGRTQMLRNRTGLPWSWRRDGKFLGVRAVRSALEPAGRAGQFDVVLDEDTVVEDSDAGGREQAVFGIESGRGPDDIVGSAIGRAGVDAFTSGGYWM
jgi:hypothetical protein